MTPLQNSTNRILSKRCDRPWNWIYLPYGTRRLYKARELPFRWTHHWLFNFLGAQFFFRILHNTWIFMELTSCHFIKLLLSNEVPKLTARFQISIGYAKYLAICFCYIKRSGDHLFLWLTFSNKYIFFQCCKLNFPRSNIPNRKSTPKKKNCRIHTTPILQIDQPSGKKLTFGLKNLFDGRTSGHFKNLKDEHL